MTKRPRKRLAALSAAALICAGSLAIFAPSAGAHNATKIVNKYTCTHTYVPEFLGYETSCSFVPTPVNRAHIHTTQRVCTWITAGGAVGGGLVGLTGGPAGPAVGGALGGLAGYEVCRLLPNIIWLG